MTMKDLGGAVESMPSLGFPAIASGGADAVSLKVACKSADETWCTNDIDTGESTAIAVEEKAATKLDAVTTNAGKSKGFGGRVGKAGVLGFEPRQADSESAVLPLHHKAIWGVGSYSAWLRRQSFFPSGLVRYRFSTPFHTGT